MEIYKVKLGNIRDIKEPSHYHFEKVLLSSDELLKTTILTKTDHNNEIGIKQEKSNDLKDGDIIFNDGKNIIYICLETTDVIIIKPKSFLEMGIIAHNLGNRHMPAQFENNNMLVAYDYLVEEYLNSQKVDYERKKIKLKEAFRHVDGAH